MTDMEITKEQLVEEQAFQRDLWNLRKKYYNGKDESDEWWAEFCAEIDKLTAKYNSIYQTDLFMACIADIERRAREK